VQADSQVEEKTIVQGTRRAKSVPGSKRKSSEILVNRLDQPFWKRVCADK
jgi:hypothetical protein